MYIKGVYVILYGLCGCVGQHRTQQCLVGILDIILALCNLIVTDTLPTAPVLSLQGN